MPTRKIDGKAYSIGEILKKGVQYNVPTYQRDFAWTVDEVETLWDDITRAMSNEKKEYFLGAIVTSHTDDPKKRDIVDGQQRLTALSMIFSAIVGKWQEHNDVERASGVKRDFLGDADRRTLSVTPKLTLNENNNEFYQSCVINGSIISARDKKNLIPSDLLLLEAFEKTKILFNEWLNSNNTPYVDALVSLEEFIRDAIYAILIETGDESDAFITFETLNDRGLELATSDLVKNLLFSKAGSNIAYFKKTWSEIVSIVGGEGLTQYIRYFWNAFYDIAKEKELYKNIKDQIKEASDAKLMLDRLRKVANYYDALSNPENPYWSGFPVEYKEYLNALSLFKVSQYRPIALAAMGTMDPIDVVKVLKIIMVISFRYTVISGLNTGTLDKIYPNVALVISKTSGIRPKAVFELLKGVYVDDSKFEVVFKEKAFNKENVARYVLRELNNEMSIGKELKAAANLTLEHVLPKNPGKEWHTFIAGKNHEDLIYKIGNLTLLEGGKNKSIGNKDFDLKKQKAYSTSELVINADIKDQMFWTDKAIELRSSKLAKLASKRWRLDYQ